MPLTERTNRRHYTEPLTIRARLHPTPHGQHLARRHCRHRTRRLRDLETPQNIPACIGERLALLERDARRQPLPVFTDEGHEAEHELLAVEDAGRAPGWEGGGGAVDGGVELLVGGFGDACEERVGGGVVQVDPAGGEGGVGCVVDEVFGGDGMEGLVVVLLGVWRGERVRDWVACWCGSGGGGEDGGGGVGGGGEGVKRLIWR